jgi:rod shape determining protein RodA
MNGIIPAPIAALNWRIIGLLTAMASFGAIVLYSAASGSLFPWAAPHMIRFTVFIVAAIIASYLPLEFWKKVTIPAYFIILLLLFVVELAGAVRGGSERWINLGFINLQPSELMKPAIVLTVAFYFDRLPASRVRDWDAMAVPLGIMALPVGLVMLQPDLGTSLAVLFGGVVVMFLAGTPLRYYIGAAAAAVVVIPFAFFFLLHGYQRNRILTFLDPESDPLGTGYHISQSKIAIGSGGITGKGFLDGTQSHLDYLPEGHTDFVFATMAEEWGMIGGFAILAGFGLLFKWGLGVAMSSPSRYGRLVASGLTCTIFFYAAINLMMVMGFAPVVGIPLPLISHGGSSMMTILGCVGILFAIERDGKRGRQSFS